MKVKLCSSKMTQKTIQRVQFPVTGTYAFTDYQSQGQTLPYVYVDIGTPPTAGLSLFNLYVGLSRSSELLAEEDRLEGLNEDTSQWWARMRRRELEFESVE
ncbi:hypothetical protein B0H17DRAFT_1014993 [Mycena rosella]|uniref:Uncharacterized protein n=1 Tax=Mycena rosella TaxID=1033263 RepID=A0AAD7D6F0_MYCRO|nr:hypothetical protein B0H17DRAFT_1014993 [Mycena rosella]